MCRPESCVRGLRNADRKRPFSLPENGLRTEIGRASRHFSTENASAPVFSTAQPFERRDRNFLYAPGALDQYLSPKDELRRIGIYSSSPRSAPPSTNCADLVSSVAAGEKPGTPRTALDQYLSSERLSGELGSMGKGCPRLRLKTAASTYRPGTKIAPDWYLFALASIRSVVLKSLRSGPA